jgi:hypothetical protein
MKKIVLILSIAAFIGNVFAEEESSERNSFVVKSDWKGVNCKKRYEVDGYVTIQECVFPKASLQQVYNIVKRIDKNLKAELPVANIKYPFVEDMSCSGCGVDYKYKAEKHLFIELLYPGGVTSVEVTEDKGSTQSKIIYVHD